ncbi:MAG TPA: hypothetical protein VLD86_03120, partial [Ilumatobacteraceae bacterium]|nr:hypothetical protein [Ilumatobacteraceae bacterium]
MSQAVPAVPAPAAPAAEASLSRRSIVGLVAVGALIALVVIYKLTRHQDVPTWLDLHVAGKAQDAYHWITQHTGRNWVLDAIKTSGKGITWCQKRVLTGLRLLHWTGVVALTFAIGYLRAGWRTATAATASMFAIGLCGFWDLTMVTLSIMTVAVAFAMVIGVPLGIWSGLSDRVERRLRP